MAKIVGSYCQVVYTYYRDVVIRMGNGIQKKQVEFVPDGINPTDYEWMVSNVTTTGSFLTYGLRDQWTTLPNLTDFADEELLLSFEVNRQDSAGVGSSTATIQFTLSVRAKSNHADIASAVIKLVPTVTAS